MKITSIVENTSVVGLPVEHGLSMYIQFDVDANPNPNPNANPNANPNPNPNVNHKSNILFDMGQRRLFAENAERLGLDIADVDIAIISHGHYDHGGGLHAFLEMNKKAKVYIHKDAFQPHYSLRENGMAYIGIAPLQLPHSGGETRITLCGSYTKINGKMTLFADVHGNCCLPPGNRLLFKGSPLRVSVPRETGEPKGVKRPLKSEGTLADSFSHEQNLIIEDGEEVVLFAGCAHNGIVNILRKAEQVIGKTPTHVLGGMHLVKSGLSEKEEDAFISQLAEKLMEYKDTKFYTMHCTGTEQYEKLKRIMGDQIEYLSCGESISI